MSLKLNEVSLLYVYRSDGKPVPTPDQVRGRLFPENALVKRMATRQRRIEDFTHDGEPPAEQPLEVLCEDHVGTYVVPFACRWSSGDWKNVATGARIEATVVGWRSRANGS